MCVSCAHYFQWFTGFLNYGDLLMLHVATTFKEIALFIVHLSCFVDFILCPTDKYMFKVNNNFIVDSEHSHSQHINIVFLLLTLNKYFVSRVRKASHNVLKTQKAICLFRNKSCKAYFIQRFIILYKLNYINYI